MTIEKPKVSNKWSNSIKLGLFQSKICNFKPFIKYDVITLNSSSIVVHDKSLCISNETLSKLPKINLEVYKENVSPPNLHVYTPYIIAVMIMSFCLTLIIESSPDFMTTIIFNDDKHLFYFSIFSYTIARKVAFCLILLNFIIQILGMLLMIISAICFKLAFVENCLTVINDSSICENLTKNKILIVAILDLPPIYGQYSEIILALTLLLFVCIIFHSIEIIGKNQEKSSFRRIFVTTDEECLICMEFLKIDHTRTSNESKPLYDFQFGAGPESFVTSETLSVVKLSCGHLFHERCVTDWMRENTSCPTCRHTFL